MNYIIMDLEWNNSFDKSTQKFINEIIEIGAVKLDSDLNTVDTYSQIIKPVISKKLRSRIKSLTHITNEEIGTGRPFQTVIRNFEKWAGNDSVIMTWGDTDIRTLLTNYKKFLNSDCIDFIKKYVDIQKYCECFINMENVQQAGLSFAAEQLEINPDDFPHHRALDDSLLSVECFKKVYNAEKVSNSIINCDSDFYARLAFHPYVISDKNDPLINSKIFDCYCDNCGEKAIAVKKWKYLNQSFRGTFRCEHCGCEFKANLRIKRFYDRLDIKRTYSTVIMTGTDNSAS